MKHLTKDDEKREPEGHHRHDRSSIRNYRRHYSHVTMPQQRFMHSNMLAMQERFHLPSSLLSPITMLNSTIPKSTHIPVLFEMFVRNTEEPPNSVPLHSFTTLRASSPKLADIRMNDNAQLLRALPQLRSLDIGEMSSTQIIMAESTLKLMSGSLPKTAELGIQFELQSFCDLEQYEDFKCSTRFFEEGEPVDKVMEGPIEYDHHHKRLGNVQFGSRFWAVKVIEMARRLREAYECRKKAQVCGSHQDAIAAENAAREIDFEIREHFLRLTALQQLTAKQCDTGRRVNLLLICWKFEQTRRDCRGETTWRNVNVFPSQQDLAKEEALQAKLDFNELALSLSQHDSTAALQSPFGAHQNFDLNDVSTMALTSIPSEPTHTAQMYPMNNIDFTDGHIHMCLPPNIPMGTTTMMNPFIDTTVDGRAQLIYEDSQQWGQQPAYSNNYFDQSSMYTTVRSFDDGSEAHHGVHATTPFDGSQGHTGTPFDGHVGDASASFHEGVDHGFNAMETVGGAGPEQALPSIEFDDETI
jgi:hypothetical protein